MEKCFKPTLNAKPSCNVKDLFSYSSVGYGNIKFPSCLQRPILASAAGQNREPKKIERQQRRSQQGQVYSSDIGQAKTIYSRFSRLIREETSVLGAKWYQKSKSQDGWWSQPEGSRTQSIKHGDNCTQPSDLRHKQLLSNGA